MTDKYLTPIKAALKRYGTVSSDVELMEHPEFNFLITGFKEGQTVKKFPQPVDVTQSPYNIIEDGIFRFGYYAIPQVLVKKLGVFIGQTVDIYFENQKHLPVIIHADQWFEISFNTHIDNLKLLITDVPALLVREFDSCFYEFSKPITVTIDSISIYAKTYRTTTNREIIGQTTAESAIKVVAGDWQCLIFSEGGVFKPLMSAVNEDMIDYFGANGFKLIRTLN